MAISKTIPPKAPSQNPTGFYQSKQQGGAYGKPERVPEKLKGGPMREKMGKPGL
ncbi:hypothetical protein Q8F57_027115 [Paraburkholderia terrae]|uniref:hypothetical protein n=1 Tax=Paraburkholderia terrae TaxID=311230 RepID=UPI00296AE42A|nr:hypothetical protein [Paraburkholderia terrae]MDW3660289.1 hypothetical protein [Paraburkholderia terrae]